MSIVRKFKGHTLRLTEEGGQHYLYVKELLQVLGYRDTDALKRRLHGEQIVEVNGMLALKAEDVVVLAQRLERLGRVTGLSKWVEAAVRPRAAEVTLGQLCAAVGIRSDKRASFYNSLRSASDVCVAMGLPGFSLGGERFTSDVLVAIAARSVVAANGKLDSSRLDALARLTKALSSGETVEDEVLADGVVPR